MVAWSRYLGYFQDFEPYSPPTDVIAGTPTLMPSGVWGVPDIDVPANTRANFRVRGLFRGKKKNSAASIALGAELTFTSGQGIEPSVGGQMKAYVSSPSGSAHVDYILDPGSSGGGGGGGSTILVPMEGDVAVTGTDNPAVDNPAVAAAVATLNAAGKGRFVGYGTIALSSRHQFTAPIDMILANGAVFKHHPTLETGIDWGIGTRPWNYTNAAVSFPAAERDVLTTTMSLNKGDIVAVWSDDTVTGITPHATGYTYRPGEILKIRGPATGHTNGYRFDDFNLHAYTTNARIAKLTTLNRIRVKNVTFVSADGNVYPYVAMSFTSCEDVELENVNLGFPAGGRISFEQCYNYRVRNGTLHDLANVEVDTVTGYGITTSWSTGGYIINVRFDAYRHGFTNGGIETAGVGTTYSYGFVKELTIDSCTFGCNGTAIDASTMQARSFLDFHAMVQRGRFINNIVHVPGYDESNIGITNRSNGVIIENNTVYSSDISKPFINMASDTIIRGNSFFGGWYCDINDGGFQPNVDRCLVEDNLFSGFGGPGLIISTGTENIVSKNTFLDCGSSAAGGKPQACLVIASLTNSSATVKVLDNLFTKKNNSFSFTTGAVGNHQIEARGNTVVGWYSQTTGVGQVNLGLDWSLAATPGLYASYGSFNTTLPAALVEFTAHGLTSSSIGKPISNTGAVWDDTSNTRIMGIMADVADADHLFVIPLGGMMEIPKTALFGSYDPTTQSRSVWWDLSVGQYVPTKPSDSTAGPVLHVAKQVVHNATTCLLVIARGDAGSANTSGSQVFTEVANVGAMNALTPTVGDEVRVATNKLAYKRTAGGWKPDPAFVSVDNAGFTALSEQVDGMMILNYEDNSLWQWTTANGYILIAGPALGGSLADGDKGDITVSSSGSVWTIDNAAVTWAKIQNTTAASVLIGRGAGAGAGSLQELTLGTNISMTGTTVNVSGSGTPAGSTGQFQYNNAGAFAGSSNLTQSGTTVAVVGGTVTTNTPALTIAQTVNGAGVTFKQLTIDVTSTANAVTSKFCDFSDDGTSRFSVQYDGSVAIGTSGAKIEGPSVGTLLIGAPAGSVRLGNTSNTAGTVQINNVAVSVYATAAIGWVPSTDASDTVDASLYRNAANNIAVRNATNPQRFDICNTHSSSTIYETFKVHWSSGVVTLTTEAGSAGGTIKPMVVGAGDAVGTNLAGSNTTVQAGRGTGTGNGGSVLFQTAAPTTSGTSLPNYTTRGEINTNGRWGFGSTADPGANFSFVADNANLGSSLLMTGYGANGTSQINNLKIRSARGTSGSPTAVQSGDLLFRFSGLGYGATGFSSSARAGIDMLCTENWTDSAQGTSITLSVTAAGGTTLAEVARVHPTGLGVLTAGNPTHPLDVNGDSIRVRTAKTPASATATGTQGQICWDSGFIYVCTATNTWVRAALSTW